jgi:O-antigen/teichoic acid export membrane protein
VLAAAVLNIALNVLLLPRLGAVAAAYSTLAAYAVMALGSLYFSQRHYPINYEYGRCAALFTGMIILSIAAGYLSPLPMAGAAGLKMLLLGSYGLLVWAVEVFRQGEMRKIAVSISRFSPRPINAWLDSLLKRGWQASRAAGSESF